MNLASFVALRYLRSPKSHSVINLISWVAGVALAVPTAALVIILSLHNGLSDSFIGIYNSFDSQIRITPKTGKFFDPVTLDFGSIDGIAGVSYSIEDNILIRKGEREHLATIKGVDSNYNKVIDIENLITHGKYEPQLGDLQQAIVGQGIAYNLGISVSLIESIDIYSMRADKFESILPTPIYRTRSISPVGVYALDQATDSKYIITPLAFAQELLGFTGKVSAAELKLDDRASEDVVKKNLLAKFGSDFKAETRFEQKESLYKAINQEKWIIYLLLMMVLLIASLSLAGSIVILIADKRSQMDTLRSMGATTDLIRTIFRREGMLIVLLGSTIGVVLGALFALVQQHFGLIKMKGESMLIDTYPVRVDMIDIAVILLGVWLIGWIISYVTTQVVVKKQ